MLPTLSLVLMVMWLWGVVTGYVLGGMLHVLPPIAILLFVIAMYRRPRWPRTRRHWSGPAHVAGPRRRP